MGYISVHFETRGNLGDLFAYNSLEIKLSAIFFQKVPKYKDKPYINCLNQYFHEKHHKNQIKHVNKRHFFVQNL